MTQGKKRKTRRDALESVKKYAIGKVFPLTLTTSWSDPGVTLGYQLEYISPKRYRRPWSNFSLVEGDLSYHPRIRMCGSERVLISNTSTYTDIEEISLDSYIDKNGCLNMGLEYPAFVSGDGGRPEVDFINLHDHCTARVLKELFSTEPLNNYLLFDLVLQIISYFV